MAYIVSRENYPGTRRLQLAGEEIFFPLQMGNNWGKIRIGMLCSCWMTWTTNGGYAATPNAGDAGVKIGLAVCNGTQGFFHPEPADVLAMAIGTVIGNRNQAIPTFANLSYVSFSQGATYYQKRAGVTTRGINYTNSTAVIVGMHYTLGNHQRQSGIYLDVDRITTPGSFVVNAYGPTAANLTTQPNTTFGAFMTAMQSNATPTNNTVIHAGAQTWAYTGSVNVFDTVSIFSNMTANVVLEVGAFAVCRYT